MDKLSFEVNNNGIMVLSQERHDGEITVKTFRDNHIDFEEEISQGDFVMLMNYYRYQKENDLEIF